MQKPAAALRRLVSAGTLAAPRAATAAAYSTAATTPKTTAATSQASGRRRGIGFYAGVVGAVPLGVGVGCVAAAHSSPAVRATIEQVLPADLQQTWLVALQYYGVAVATGRQLLVSLSTPEISAPPGKAPPAPGHRNEAAAAAPAPATPDKTNAVPASPPPPPVPQWNTPELTADPSVAEVSQLLDGAIRHLEQLLQQDHRADTDFHAEQRRIIAHLLQMDVPLLMQHAAHRQQVAIAAAADRQLAGERAEWQAQMATEKHAADEALAQQRDTLGRQRRLELEESLAAAHAESAAEMRAQAAAMQATFDRELHRRLDEERHGRLARLQELALGVSVLEQRLGDTTQLLGESRAQQHHLAEWNGFMARLEQQMALDGTASGGTDSVVHSRPALGGVHVPAVVSAALDSMAGVDAVPSLAQLRHSFRDTVQSVRRVAAMPDTDSGNNLEHYLWSSVLGWLRHLRHQLQSLSAALSPTAATEYTLSSTTSTATTAADSVETVLARAESALYGDASDGNGVEAAVLELNSLRGVWCQWAAEPWLEAARAYLTVRQAVAVVQASLAVEQLAVAQQLHQSA